MSGKLLHSLSDENPDLKRQIGCMNGIFQLFDRRHFFTGRRSDDSGRKRFPPGQNDKQTVDPNNASERAKEINVKKVPKDRHRISTESSRTSFSSSSSSSTFSSVDCNKTAQPEVSSFSQTSLLEIPSQDLSKNLQNSRLHSGRRSQDLRDVVKSSINRETHGLSVKIESEGAAGHGVKHVDSPRPSQVFNSSKLKVSGSNESFRVLAKLRETPRSPNGERRCSPLLAPKDAPRFSYDGRELRETIKSTIKIKELPRLSLDSRDSRRGFTAELKPNYLLGDLNSNKIQSPQQEPESNKRPSIVVAKLMGLESFPDLEPNNDNEIRPIKTCTSEDSNPSSRTLSKGKKEQISGSPRNFFRDPISPRLRNAGEVTKPSSSSKFPIEPAPWKQPDVSRGSQKTAFKCREAPTKTPNSSTTVYGEIEKRLAELEFRKSGKDLRALKQILEAMQKTTEMLEAQKMEQASHLVSQTGSCSPNYRSLDQSSKLTNRQNLQSNHSISAQIKGASPSKNSRFPIVVMKPVKLIDKADNPASTVMPVNGLSGLCKLQTGSSISRKDSVDQQAAKDHTRRNNHLREHSNRPLRSMDKNASIRRSTQTSRELLTREQSTSSRSLESISPKLQQKKLGLEKQSHPTSPSLESSRDRRQSSRQLRASGSPARKPRLKAPNWQRSDDELSEVSSEARNFHHQADASSLQSESNISLGSQIDIEVISTGRSEEINSTIQQVDQKYENPVQVGEYEPVTELVTSAQEQPSPVSVLDAMFYIEDSPSPVKKTSNTSKGNERLNSYETDWNTVDMDHLNNEGAASLSPTILHAKLEYKQHMVQKFRQLNLIDNEPTIDMAPLIKNANMDHGYISEILLASGFLDRELHSGLTPIQQHSSGHSINPNLFIVLEQTKANNRISNEENSSQKISQRKLNQKIQRKLLFDVVGEILTRKLDLGNSSLEAKFSQNKLVRRNPTGQQLLSELCSEIDQLQVNSSNSKFEDDDDGCSSILREDLAQHSTSWTNFHSEFSGVVLDVERLIFKDLVVEIVKGEAADLQAQRRTCRQLFSK